MFVSVQTVYQGSIISTSEDWFFQLGSLMDEARDMYSEDRALEVSAVHHFIQGSYTLGGWAKDLYQQVWQAFPSRSSTRSQTTETSIHG